MSAVTTSRLGWALREPTLHFLVAGLALFVVWRALHPVIREPSASVRIDITADDVRQISAVLGALTLLSRLPRVRPLGRSAASVASCAILVRRTPGRVRDLIDKMEGS